MKEYPFKFSVAVATCNHEKYLSRALESIVAQKHDYPFEIVISDDASSDQTQEIAKAYQKKIPGVIRTIVHSMPVGVAKNSLCAIRACQGEYIATLDGEDYWTDPTKLQRQIQFLEAHREFTISCHRFKQLFEDTGAFSNDFVPNDLFKNSLEGAEFGTELYFKYWLTQKLSVVFRSSALENTPQLDTNRYSWDAQVFWKILAKGKGYIHNFVGGVYSIPSKVPFSKNDELSYSAVQYLLLEELLRDEPSNPHLNKTIEIYRATLLSAQQKNRNLLDIRKIDIPDFTIVSNDNWGKEVYKAFGIEEQSPFIGIHIFNADFIKLVSNLDHYLGQSLEFIPIAASRHNATVLQKNGHTYPLALLGHEIELHFIDYTSAEDAKEKWQNRIKRINWNNLFFKLDASYEDVNIDEIGKFLNLKNNGVGTACFLTVFQKKKFENHALKDAIAWIDHWSTEIEILFSFSLNSFNLVGWLNGEPGIYADKKNSVDQELFRPDKEKLKHYFMRFYKRNILQLDALLHPDAYRIHFSEENSAATVQYDKTDMEHFYLATQEKLYNREREFLDISVDLSNHENRHVFILAKGHPDHVLRVDFVAREIDPEDIYSDNHEHIRLHSDGLEQDIPAEFEWMHFDYSRIHEDSMEKFFARVCGFCFYINPGRVATGTLQIIAIYAGSVNQFEKIIQ